MWIDLDRVRDALVLWAFTVGRAIIGLAFTAALLFLLFKIGWDSGRTLLQLRFPSSFEQLLRS